MPGANKLAKDAREIFKLGKLRNIVAEWWVSADLRRVQGCLQFQIVDDHRKALVNWFDSIQLRPLSK